VGSRLPGFGWSCKHCGHARAAPQFSCSPASAMRSLCVICNEATQDGSGAKRGSNA
jgi:hypothetical protein